MLDTVDCKRSFLKQREHGWKLFFWEKIFEPPPFQANYISSAPSLFPNPSPSILTTLHHVIISLLRVDDWLFMSSPWPVLALCAVYYYIVRYAGPAFMKDRPPYDIQKLMIAYNFFQTLLSLWVFQKACYFWLTGRYNWLCQPVDYSNTEEGMLAADMTWWYFFSKFIDYLDSFFFVLRKKWSHLSTLHVVHHGIMPFTAWWGIR